MVDSIGTEEARRKSEQNCGKEDKVFHRDCVTSWVSRMSFYGGAVDIFLGRGSSSEDSRRGIGLMLICWVLGQVLQGAPDNGAQESDAATGLGAGGGQTNRTDAASEYRSSGSWWSGEIIEAALVVKRGDTITFETAKASSK